MTRWETVHGAVRWDAYETKVDVTGTLNVDELDDLIATLQKARADREDVRGVEAGVAQLDSEVREDGAEVPDVASSSTGSACERNSSSPSVEQRALSSLVRGSSPRPSLHSTSPHPSPARCLNCDGTLCPAARDPNAWCQGVDECPRSNKAAPCRAVRNSIETPRSDEARPDLIDWSAKARMVLDLLRGEDEPTQLRYLEKSLAWAYRHAPRPETAELLALRKVAQAARARLEVWTRETYGDLVDAFAELDKEYENHDTGAARTEEQGRERSATTEADDRASRPSRGETGPGERAAQASVQGLAVKPLEDELFPHLASVIRHYRSQPDAHAEEPIKTCPKCEWVLSDCTCNQALQADPLLLAIYRVIESIGTVNVSRTEVSTSALAQLVLAVDEVHARENADGETPLSAEERADTLIERMTRLDVLPGGTYKPAFRELLVSELAKASDANR